LKHFYIFFLVVCSSFFLRSNPDFLKFIEQAHQKKSSQANSDQGKIFLEFVDKNNNPIVMCSENKSDCLRFTEIIIAHIFLSNARIFSVQNDQAAPKNIVAANIFFKKLNQELKFLDDYLQEQG
jgi:hypothetical protein